MSPADDVSSSIPLGDEPKRKRAKKALKGPRCSFFIERKNRQCPLQVPSGKKWCRQHDPDQSERVNCPLDPTHTVVKSQLSDHLQRCNKRFRDRPWFQEDLHWLPHKVNTTEPVATGDETSRTTEQADAKDDNCEDKEATIITLNKNPGEVSVQSNSQQTALIDHVLAVLNGINFEPLKKRHLHHQGLEPRLNQVTNQKHALQQSSLIGALDYYGLLSKDNYYVEFGCGKAEFSKYVADCIVHDNQDISMDKLGFGLIDRGVNRLKTDGKLRQITSNVKRDRIDIKDLDLAKFLQGEPATRVVAISKHLCGVATDLTLRCIQPVQERVAGAVVAMCCRHVCNYYQLAPEARDFLAQHDIVDELQFKALQKIASWAVDGGKDVEVGLKARRLIDEARAQGVRNQFAQFKVELIEYADRATTLENCAMCVYIT